MVNLQTIAEGKQAESACLLDLDVVQAHILKAANYFAAYRTPENLDGSGTDITLALELTRGEWVTIKPLFDAYCALDQAEMIEANRMFGMQESGPSASEVLATIPEIEKELQKNAFVCRVITVI